MSHNINDLHEKSDGTFVTEDGKDTDIYRDSDGEICQRASHPWDDKIKVITENGDLRNKY